MSEPTMAGRGAAGPSPTQPGRVTIPGVILAFLEHATLALAGTRNADLVPRLHRLSGWRVEPDHQSMTVFVATAFAQGMLPSLEDNGHLAVTIEEMGPHETYQFKGRYLGSRPCTEADRVHFRRIRDRFGSVVTANLGIPVEVCRAHILEPELAVTFEVQEIYLQTPGPGAGRRLAPPEEK
jgi:hypothetical protein